MIFCIILALVAYVRQCSTVILCTKSSRVLATRERNRKFGWS